jgi:Tol biopolymer transport system component/imidazolonepropionase-like amidohydrolase
MPRPDPSLPSLLTAATMVLLLASPTLHAQDTGSGEWDVNAPPFEFTDVELDVDEGTWMALDVSPEGTEIVFDLLGDLYIMPIEGGEARPLTREIAWNMQPRFSPDGNAIAFISDRSGGDNIWIMDRDGSNLRQVTDESFRLLHNPTWSPDGDYIVARKHYTGTRSLGAGEMWMYHRSGGTGIRLTERPNDQKDANEPVFSPDGRHLYFTQDMTPGPVFEYNKDSNAGIFTIRELDLETGDLRNVTGGPGGAVRPTPSPDGRTLAFIRRVRFDTHLFLRDMESGREWSVYGDLERDMQEIWSIHGLYPGISWTPDGTSLVFWARGGLHRLDVESGDVQPIPFRVQTTRQVARSIRFPVDVHPEEFDVRLLRWVQVAPDGERVAYSALGHLWVRELDGGEARRVTSQEDHFEYYPSWSRDGERLVYVSWSDEELSAVRVVSASGAERGEPITVEPGHYREPVFSPDGESIVYRKSGGGGIVSPHWSEGQGIYRVPAAGGEPQLLRTSGSDAHFGASSDRVFFQDSEGGRRILQSIGVDGTGLRTHLTSQWATSFRVSPDERHVAFQERYQAYLRPFVASAGPVDVGPGSRDLPQQRVSRDAGDWLHWSGDGEQLHWALGPQLFTLDVSQAFEHLAGEGDVAELPLAEGENVAFRATADTPDGVVAFTGARLITMRGDEVIEDGTVVVEGNRITAVGPAGEVEVPAGAHVVDATDQTIMPGIIDVHWHGSQGFQGVVPDRNRMNYASLAFGVTTIHNPSTNTAEFTTAAEMARVGHFTSPRLFSTGQILYGATTAGTAEVDSLEDAREHLRRLGNQGVISVKSYNQPRRDQRQQILTAAWDEGLLVVTEGGALFHHNMTMIVDGHTGIEHSLPVEDIYDDVIQMWSASEAGITPTLVVAFGGLWGEEYWYSNTNVWDNERLMAFNPPLTVEARSRRRMQVPDEEWNHIRTAAHTNKLYQAGIGVQLGAHGQRQGLDAHWELWSFGQGGMPAHDALKVATIEGARYLGMDEQIGSLQEGKLADLIVLDENPLENLRNSETVRWTMVNGRLYDAYTMDEVGNHPRERGTFYWEDWGWR